MATFPSPPDMTGLRNAIATLSNIVQDLTTNQPNVAPISIQQLNGGIGNLSAILETWEETGLY